MAPTLKAQLEAACAELATMKKAHAAVIDAHASEMINLRENLQSLLEDKNKIISGLQDEVQAFRLVIQKERESHEETRIHLSEWIERTKRHEYWLSITERQYQMQQKRAGVTELELQELLALTSRPIRHIYARLRNKIDKEFVYVGANPREDPETFMQIAAE